VQAYLRRLGAGLGWAAGLFAAYLAAAAVHLEWLALLLALAIAFIASIPGIWRPLRNAIAAATRYPATIRRLTEVEAELAEANKQVAALGVAVDDSFRRGIEFGQRQLQGVTLGLLIWEMPVLIAITGDASQLKLVGRYDESEAEDMGVGAWFEVVVEGTGDKRGTVEVLAIDTVSKVVEMTCVERTVEAFWSALEHRVEADPSPPAGVELRPVSGFKSPRRRLLEGG
jgi:hypothetical protein